MSKYGDFSGPYFSVFSPNTGNMDQKKLRIGTLFTQCHESWLGAYSKPVKIRVSKKFGNGGEKKGLEA